VPGVTTVRPDTLRVGILDDSHRAALEELVDAEPVVNAMPSARLRSVRSIAPARLGAMPVGVTAGARVLAAAFHGAHLVPIGGDAPSWYELGRHLAQRRRECTSIVGPADAVRALWTQLAPAWGPPRAIRRSQPLLLLDRPSGLVDDERLRRLRPDEVESYLRAAAAMFTEELGVSPLGPTNVAGYRRRAEQMLGAGRAFGIVDAAGAVAFKADIGALTPHTCQLQGVWVRPDLRGRGLGTAGMSAVLLRALSLAPTASLYVNDFNAVARRLYAGLGMRQVAKLSTILF
jgi:predicted GNAT family acetyltransferase